MCCGRAPEHMIATFIGVTSNLEHPIACPHVIGANFNLQKVTKKYFCNCYEIRHLLYAKLSVLGIIEIHPMAFFRCQLSLLRTIERDPITSFRCQLSLLWIIGSCPTASFRCRSSCLWIIRKMPITPFIPIESFSNSSKFGHRVVYSIAPIIR